MKSIFSAALLAAIVAASPAHAANGYADVVLDFVDGGQGNFPGPNGGDNIQSNIPISPSVLLGPAPNGEFLSLSTGSYVTLGFTTASIIDGLGADIAIGETSAADDQANVFVSSNGVDFTFLGLALDDRRNLFDLATINFTAPVTAIRVVGLNNAGSIQGFDLTEVRGLNLGPAVAGVPEPATWAAMLLGFGMVGAGVRRRRAAVRFAAA